MFFDLHNDLLTSGLSIKKQAAYLDSNHDTKIVLAYFTSKQAKPLKRICTAIKSFKDKKNVLFSIEDMHFATFENLEFVANLPLSYVTLAWSEDNSVAGGHKGSGGITFLGRELIQRFNEKNIAIDTAHINKKSFFQVLSYGKKVFCSHTCQSSIFEHSRNLNDEQIRALIERNGIVGLTLVSDFMGNAVADRQDFIKQIDTFCSKFGDKHLAIGTDFFGTKSISGLKSYHDFCLLRLELYKLGYSSQAVDNIFYHNAAKFFAS